MLVVVEDPGRGLMLTTPRRRDVWSCRLRGASLDRTLASGRAPERCRDTAVRASLLVDPRERRAVAGLLERLLMAAGEDDWRAGPRLGVGQRRRIRAAAGSLRRVVMRLNAAAPVTATGMAMLQVLLSDGAGPLHGPGTAASLQQALDAAADALDAPLDWSDGP